jgi:hypothetical protein
MATMLGGGEYVYQELAEWARLPEGWSLKEVVDIAVDAQDRVHVFNRGEHPMIVFEPDGSFVTAWGEGLFARPHGVTLGPDGTAWTTMDTMSASAPWTGKC